MLIEKSCFTARASGEQKHERKHIVNLVFHVPSHALILALTNRVFTVFLQTIKPQSRPAVHMNSFHQDVSKEFPDKPVHGPSSQPITRSLRNPTVHTAEPAMLCVHLTWYVRGDEYACSIGSGIR